VLEKIQHNNKEFELERVPITRKGYESLRKELEQLKTVERPQNIKAIEEARAHGDLSENAEFEAAKERQAFLEARISELSFKLNNADIIDPNRLPMTGLSSPPRFCWKTSIPKRAWNISWWARMNRTSTVAASVCPPPLAGRFWVKSPGMKSCWPPRGANAVTN
jgi:hypothetical protein